VSLGWIEQPAQQAQRGGLAGAIRPHQTEDLALGHREIQVVHRSQFAEATREAGGFDDGLHGSRMARLETLTKRI
jgi:hypothetical protein